MVGGVKVHPRDGSGGWSDVHGTGEQLGRDGCRCDPGEGAPFGLCEGLDGVLCSGRAIVLIDGDEVGDPLAERGRKVGADGVEVLVAALDVARNDLRNVLSI